MLIFKTSCLMKSFIYFVLIIELFTVVSSSSPCIEGSRTPNPKDCSKYSVCNHGSLIKTTCSGGLHFSVALNDCDWPDKAGCATGIPTTTVATTPTTTRTSTIPSVSLVPATLVPVTAAPPPTPKPINKFKVICYFTDWAIYRSGLGQFSPENVDPSLCTHIIYSFALLDPVASIMKIADNNTAIDKKFYEKLTAFKSKGAKVNLAIGGWADSVDDRYSKMVNDPIKRINFVKQAVLFLKTYNFDGLDLDWEYPRCWQGNCNAGPVSDKTSFTNLVTELRAALPVGALLSAAVSASKPVISEAYDVPTLSKVLDWIGIMDYDFHTGWEKKTGHIAPFYYKKGDDFDYLNVNYSISYWIQLGADPSKLIMGIPFYGNSFLLSNTSNNALFAPTYLPGRPGPFTAQAGMLAYYEICSQLSTLTVVQDPENAMGPYAYNNDLWISYDDVEIVKLKANYIKNKNLGGGMVWALDFDDFNGACGKGKYPVLTALSKTLNG